MLKDRGRRSVAGSRSGRRSVQICRARDPSGRDPKLHIRWNSDAQRAFILSGARPASPPRDAVDADAVLSVPWVGHATVLQKTDGIHRASGEIKPEPGKAKLLETRRQVVRGWSEVADDLVLQDQVDLALAVRRFAKELPPVRTEREWIRDRILEERVRRRSPSSARAHLSP